MSPEGVGSGTTALPVGLHLLFDKKVRRNYLACLRLDEVMVDVFPAAVKNLPQTGLRRVVTGISQIGKNETKDYYIRTNFQVTEHLCSDHMGVLSGVDMIEMANQSLLLLARLIGLCGPNDLAEFHAADSFITRHFVLPGEILLCEATVILVTDERRPKVSAQAILSVVRRGEEIEVGRCYVVGRMIGSRQAMDRLLRSVRQSMRPSDDFVE